jgi:DNA processing protein
VFSADDVLVELAPQLGREARSALEKRLEERAGGGSAPARNPSADPYAEALAGAEPVLPDVGLPWTAPAPAAKGADDPSPAVRARSKRASGARIGRQAPRLTPQRAHQPADSPQERRERQNGIPGLAGRQRHSPPEELSDREEIFTEEERRVLSALGPEPRHIDQLTRALDLDVSRLSGLLTLLEVRGLVRRAPGMYYAVSKK